MYGKILVAVDGSSSSDAALGEALELARDRGASLRVLHVVDSPYAYPDAMYGHVTGDLDDLREAWEKAGQDIVAQAVARAREAGVEPETRLVEGKGGHVARSIVEEARAWGADVIVMGTHGRRGIDRLLMGSVAEGVARTAPVSVLLVRRDPAASP
jgi:nucleotide-binding universal stress UspA family protein